MTTFAGPTGLTIFVLTLGGALTTPALAESVPSKPGRPDLHGTWTNATLTPWERPKALGGRAVLTAEEVAQLEGGASRSAELAQKPTDPDATVETLPNDCSGGRTWCNYNAQWTEPGSTVMRVDGAPRSSLVTEPSDGRVPYRPGKSPAVIPVAERASTSARGPEEEGNLDHPEQRGLGERCLASQSIREGAILTPTLYNNTYQILQTAEAVVIVVEMSHDARIIRLNEAPPNNPVPAWFGTSVGRYEGDALVVQTSGFHPAQLKNLSPKLKLTEWFRRVGPDRLHYRFRVEDPETFTQPWGGEYEFGRSNGPLYEYACHEGNRGLEGTLAGARQAEKEAAEAAAKSSR